MLRDRVHHQVVGPDLELDADAGMIQRGYGSNFAIESLTEAPGGNLDRHVAPSARTMRAENIAYAAFAAVIWWLQDRGARVRTGTNLRCMF